MRTALHIAIVAIILGMVPGSAWSAEPDIKYGQWEITMTMEGGMMAQPMSFTNTQCLTKENYVPTKTSPQEKNPCTMKQTSVKGNTVTWEGECPSEQGKVTTKGEITYRRTSFDGTVRTTMTMEGRPMTMVTKMKGQRIGECR